MRQEGIRSKRVVALDEVTFSATEGEFVGIIGHNGAGKSTTIKTLMGFLRADGGKVRVRGLDPSETMARKNLGYVPENASFSDFLTGGEILDSFGRMSGLETAARKVRTRELLEALDIAHAASRRVKTYSKGMTQRLAIAQALLTRPEILILDEPMTGLDPVGRRQVLDVLALELKRGVSLLFCSHLLSDVQQLCERVLWFQQGKIKYDGQMRALIEDRSQFELHYRGLSPIAGAIEIAKEVYRVMLQPEDLQSVITTIEKSGGRIESFNPTSRALEDIFVSAHGKS